MLPNLHVNHNYGLVRSTQPKIYQLEVNEQANLGFSHSSKKISQKIISNFKPSFKYKKYNSMNYNYNKHQQLSKIPIFINKQSVIPNLSNQIKEIQKKIRKCQRKIELEKKYEQQTLQANQYPNQYDFQKVIDHQIGLQTKYNTLQNQQNFDYLTNPGKQLEQGQQPIIMEEEKLELQKPYIINEGLQKLQRHYENSLRKKFQRRELFPHQTCKRKTPKLFITQKNNALNKQGKPLNEEQHIFRVITKETTPQQIYPTIPNFSIVKDNLSKNIVAYLGDYKPFLDKTKQNDKKPITKQQNSKKIDGEGIVIVKENLVA